MLYEAGVWKWKLEVQKMNRFHLLNSWLLAPKCCNLKCVAIFFEKLMTKIVVNWLTFEKNEKLTLRVHLYSSNHKPTRKSFLFKLEKLKSFLCFCLEDNSNDEVFFNRLSDEKLL